MHPKGEPNQPIIRCRKPSPPQGWATADDVPQLLTEIPCRLLITPPAAGPWNMAVDEMLLDRAAQGAGLTLRFYSWKPATLSLGYFQSAQEIEAHTPLAVLPFVRRLSGGGAILHDREITYALILPAAHPLTADPTAVYGLVHHGIAAALRHLGLPAELHDDPTSRCQDGHTPAVALAEPFLCFLRRGYGDVLLAGRKVAGSAQRRRRGALLQHGSLIPQASAHLPLVPGVGGHNGAPLAHDRLLTVLTEAIAASLRLSLRPGELSPDEREAAHRLAETKYRSDHWNRRR